MAESVVVCFDGAWEPGGTQGSEYWAYGYVVSGSGLNFEFKHASILPPLANLMVSFIGSDGEPGFPIHAHCVLVADLEGAAEALLDLKKRGYRGDVIMRGDSIELIEAISAGRPFSSTRVDSALLEQRRAILSSAIGIFSSVRWEWIPRDENTAADALAKEALHAIIEWKKNVLTAVRTHPDRNPAAAILAEFMTGILPGRVYESGLESRVCECGSCVAERDAGPGSSD